MDCDIASYHVGSFDFLADEGVHLAAIDVPAQKFRLKNDGAVEMQYTKAELDYPHLESSSAGVSSSATAMRLYPSECRQRGITYKGQLKVSIQVRVDGMTRESCEFVVGEIPIMLMSSRCHLRGLSRSELVRRGEEATEKGGYFVVKGSEKVIRLLVANRRNFPIAIQRSSLKESGELFTQYAIMMRCIKQNHSASMLTLHYLATGAMTLALQFRREKFYVPLMYILKALVPMNDACIKEHLMRARPNDHFWAGCVTTMLSMSQDAGLINQESALRLLGTRFRVALKENVGPWEKSEDVGAFLLRSSVAIHLSDNEEKFFLLVYMAQKLVALAKGECAPESPDNPQFQEAAVSGHIMLLTLRERLETVLRNARYRIEQEAQKKETFRLNSRELLRALRGAGSITHGMEFFLATGNLVTQTGLGLQQTQGFSVIAERINYLRFVSHFRAIHRGAFFMEMRTTDVRKLRPEAWGFICPVHTPDGAPCGLLNHVTASVRIVTHYSSLKHISTLLNELGVLTHSAVSLTNSDEMYPVLVDGRFVGYVPYSKASYVEKQLRLRKVDEKDKSVPYCCEIVLIKRSEDPTRILTQYPGLYILSDPAHMIRPVKNLVANTTEFIGTFEQVYLSICIEPSEAEPGVTEHQELHPSCLFSFAGNLIPFPDHNQSPRNVYQCQMGKQTMGTPIHAWCKRADNKMYRLQFPQSPLLKPGAYDKYEMDEYPLGTNACVAVISYTGYDMEDAMIINKSSFQRGFAHGTVIKVERVNLVESRGGSCSSVFMADPKTKYPSIGEDGLPIPGRLYQLDDPYYTVLSLDTGTYRTQKFHSVEPAFCGLVRIVEEGAIGNGKCHALIQWRIQRNPIIGDKFASRHGQKGINSFLWPAESMPFSETGMMPDIIFNPHGFPSRMTIGMMIESMAGKAAATHGEYYDASPFVFNEKKTAIDHFGRLLQLSGYNYYGNEVMYSGVDGREMEVQIFFGIVYYQRLRHMIADKFQVRSTGAVDPVTNQPVQGRKRGGGIRFGEMERDALIAHGASFSLQDRLFNNSDRDLAHICARCGSLISVLRCAKSRIDNRKAAERDHTERERCVSCKEDDQIYVIEIPRVFRYLVAELAAMNVRVQLSVKPPSQITR